MTAAAPALPTSPLILVVERDPNVRELVVHFLERAGYAVEFADDGQAALAKATSLVPSVLVTEILVPKLDGLALCRTLKADPRTKHVRVLIFSILAAKVRAKEAGADAFMPKPLAQGKLIEMLQRLLDAGADATPKEQP